MNKYGLIILVLAGLVQWNCRPDQTAQDPLEQVAVSWQLESNQIADASRFRASFTLTNRGNAPIRQGEWSLYFNQTPRDIVAGSVRGPVEIERVNGDLYQLRPASGFTLTPGDSLTITYEGEAWLIKETDAPLGLYFVRADANGQEETIPVARYTIWPFERSEQYSRHKNDKTPFPDPALIYDENDRSRMLPLEEVPLITPSPVSVERRSGSMTIDEQTVIYFDPVLRNESELLKSGFAGFLDANLSTVELTNNSMGTGIELRIDPELPASSPDAYRLEVSAGKIAIAGKSAAGVFYGIQSLISLIPVENWVNKATSIEIPQLRVNDAPRFAYRGLMLDIARNFNNAAAIKKVIDGMAFYKLNKLHLHLTDDEGWRLEIPGLAELTEVGARRGHTPDESDRLAPAYGSGPGGAGSYGTGFLSRTEFIDLLQYATRRHIEVIPEINMPGHARAAIKSMEARYRRLSVDNDLAAAENFRLADPEDRSDYRSVQYYPDNVVCVCCEGTYRFYEKVVDEVRAMFAEAGAPLTMIHTGGDEVPAGVWTASPACESLMAQESEVSSTADLSTYFFSRIRQILADRGLKAAGWEEIAMLKTEEDWVPHPAFKGGDVIPYVWQNLWGNQDLGYRLANAGYPVVLCNVTNLYFDLAYNKDPSEPGFYWGGFVDTRKAFDFRPFDVLASTTEDPMGNPFNPETDYRDMERLQPTAQENILGIQAQLWSETIKGPDMLEYYIFPKIAGLAERAWGPPLPPQGAGSDRAWERFANALGQRELIHLDYLSGGYNYRIPPPGAKIEDGRALANVAFPGLNIRYTTDGSEPTTTAELYTGPVPVDSLICFKTFDSRGRSSRMVCLNDDGRSPAAR